MRILNVGVEQVGFSRDGRNVLLARGRDVVTGWTISFVVPVGDRERVLGDVRLGRRPVVAVPEANAVPWLRCRRSSGSNARRRVVRGSRTHSWLGEAELGGAGLLVVAGISIDVWDLAAGTARAPHRPEYADRWLRRSGGVRSARLRSSSAR